MLTSCFNAFPTLSSYSIQFQYNQVTFPLFHCIGNQKHDFNSPLSRPHMRQPGRMSGSAHAHVSDRGYWVYAVQSYRKIHLSTSTVSSPVASLHLIRIFSTFDNKRESNHAFAFAFTCRLVRNRPPDEGGSFRPS